MEDADYAFGASDLCAAGFGGAHIRQRLYWMANANNAGLEGWREPERGCSVELSVRESGVASGLADTASAGLEVGSSETRGGRRQEFRSERLHATGQLDDRGRSCSADGFWRDADWLFCRDGKWRPVRPGTFPLAHGAPARVGRLRAYGNALDAQTATQFVAAVMDCAP
jgi:DNA (cytosine-5)-methyltransferase 1